MGGVSVCARAGARFFVCVCVRTRAHTHRAVNAHSSSNSHLELGEGKIGSHQREKVKGWVGVVALTLAAPGRAGVGRRMPGSLSTRQLRVHHTTAAGSFHDYSSEKGKQDAKRRWGGQQSERKEKEN